MSYMIKDKALFVKVTRTSPIWPTPLESWIQIDLSQLPDEVAGIVEFKPLPPPVPCEPEGKKDEGIKLYVAPVSSEPDAEVASGSSRLVGYGESINGVKFGLFEFQPLDEKKDMVYLMEMESGKKYTASKVSIDSMVALFDRLHSTKDCSALSELRNRMLRATDNVAPIKNTHYFSIFFNLLVLQGKVSVFPMDGRNKHRIVINRS